MGVACEYGCLYNPCIPLTLGCGRCAVGVAGGCNMGVASECS